MSLLRRLLLLAATAGLVATMVVFGLRGVLPPTPPQVPSLAAPERGPLTRHLLLVVVDGLRKDIAEDPTIMPGVAEGLRRHSSAEVWAGEITMTSSTVLAWATGQYGSIEHVIFNETARPTELDNWLSHAKRAGLVMTVAGDRAWIDQFPGSWDETHPDPPGVSMEVDYNDEIFDAARQYLFGEPRANVVVAHFVPPDHQAHVHGVFAEPYRAHLRGFDAKLSKLLASLSSDWTVFLLSDHGMTDPGTHGSNTPTQRRTSMYAYGPGIRSVGPSDRVYGHADLAATFARLLGLPSPVHGLGHVVADWLDLPEAERARVACEELDRIGRFARASGISSERIPRATETACAAETVSARIALAHDASNAIAGIMRDEGLTAPKQPWFALGLGLFGGLALAVGWNRRPSAIRWGRWLGAVASFVALAVLAIWMVREVERLPGDWPNGVRVPLFILANCILLLMALRLRRTAEWIDRLAPLSAVLLLGVLLVSYTKNAHVESYVIFAASSVVLLLPGYTRWQLVPRAGLWLVPPWRALLALGLVAVGSFIGVEAGFVWPDLFLRVPAWPRALSVVAIVLFAIDRLARRPGEWSGAGDKALLLGLTAMAAASPWLRTSGWSTAAIAGWAVGPVVGVWLWWRGKRSAAELVGLATYGLVARDLEVLTLIPSIFVAETLGSAIAAATARADEARAADPKQPAAQSYEGEPRFALVLALVTLLFAMAFVQRVGIQLSLDFPSYDWAAGTFGDGGVSLWRIGAAIVTKHCLAHGALLLGLLAPLAPSLRGAVIRGLLIVAFARSTVLIATLFECQGSFWTTFRVLGELPHALMSIAVATVASVAALRAQRTAAEPRREAAPTAEPSPATP